MFRGRRLSNKVPTPAQVQEAVGDALWGMDVQSTSIKDSITCPATFAAAAHNSVQVALRKVASRLCPGRSFSGLLLLILSWQSHAQD